MAYADHQHTSQQGHTVRTWTMAEYRASHPPAQGFPPTSEAAARIVAILIWALIAMAVVYIALRFAGVTG